MDLDPDAYWRQTPRTFSNAVRGRVEALEAGRREQLVQAWQIAKLVGISKVPPLEKILKANAPRKPAARMTAAQIENIFDGMAARSEGRPHGR